MVGRDWEERKKLLRHRQLVLAVFQHNQCENRVSLFEVSPLLVLLIDLRLRDANFYTTAELGTAATPQCGDALSAAQLVWVDGRNETMLIHLQQNSTLTCCSY